MLSGCLKFKSIPCWTKRALNFGWCSELESCQYGNIGVFGGVVSTDMREAEDNTWVEACIW